MATDRTKHKEIALKNKTIVYGTHSVDKAYIICTELLDTGIDAQVLEDAQSNLGFEMGWHGHTAAVVVPDDQAKAAIDVIRMFEEDGIHKETSPRCPECNTPRQTSCPICGTTGTEFLKADHDLVLTDQPLSDTPIQPCENGCGGCPSQDPSEISIPGPDETHQAESNTVTTLLMCPVCDEPFAPGYRRRCTSCKYEFEDGTEVDLIREEPPEQVNNRVVLTIAGLALVIISLITYLAYIVR